MEWVDPDINNLYIWKNIYGVKYLHVRDPVMKLRTLYIGN